MPQRAAFAADRGRGWAQLWLAAAASLTAALTALPAAADDDLPGRVGRVAEFAGELFLSPEDRATEWEAIGLNYPVTSGDNLWVSSGGRAEVDYGGGQFRLAGDTNLHVSRLDDRQVALFIAQGRLILRVRVLDAGDVTRVDTPNTQVTLTRPGLYRVEVLADRQQTSVVVREGEALIALAHDAQQVLPGQMATSVGPDPAVADVRNGFGTDGFDAWSASRDRHYDQARSATYVSRQMVGYADLDAWGTWQTYPEYGAVWFPTAVAPGWAPYRDGYWTNVGGWGYTWVDNAPWGYAPFHYGRWAWIGGRWGWCPGTYVARPVWAPALVGWVGGAGWGLSVSTGGPVYGWVPLGWGEPYVPWWKRCSYNCWTHYNRPYRVNVTTRPATPPQRYSHAGVPGAITAVAAPTITGRRPVSTNLVQVPASLATSAPVMATTPAVTPGPATAPRVRPGTPVGGVAGAVAGGAPGTGAGPGPGTAGGTTPGIGAPTSPGLRPGAAGDPGAGTAVVPPPASTLTPPRRSVAPGQRDPSRPGTPTTVTPPVFGTIPPGQATPSTKRPPTPATPAAPATPPSTATPPSAAMPPGASPSAPPSGASRPAGPRPSESRPAAPWQRPGATPATPPPAVAPQPAATPPPAVTSPAVVAPPAAPPAAIPPAAGPAPAIPAQTQSRPQAQQRGPREPQFGTPPAAAPAQPPTPIPVPAPAPPAARDVPPSAAPAPRTPPGRATPPTAAPPSAGGAPGSPPRSGPPPVPAQARQPGAASQPAPAATPAPAPAVVPAPQTGGQGARGAAQQAGRGSGQQGGRGDRDDKGGKSSDDKPDSGPTPGRGGPPK
jgi:hypothetical protein